MYHACTHARIHTRSQGCAGGYKHAHRRTLTLAYSRSHTCHVRTRGRIHVCTRLRTRYVAHAWIDSSAYSRQALTHTHTEAYSHTCTNLRTLGMVSHTPVCAYASAHEDAPAHNHTRAHMLIRVHVYSRCVFARGCAVHAHACVCASESVHASERMCVCECACARVV